jgi:predicted deacetylase
MMMMIDWRLVDMINLTERLCGLDRSPTRLANWWLRAVTGSHQKTARKLLSTRLVTSSHTQTGVPWSVTSTAMKVVLLAEAAPMTAPLQWLQPLVAARCGNAPYKANVVCGPDPQVNA